MDALIGLGSRFRGVQFPSSPQIFFFKNKIMKRVTILSVIVVLLLLVMVACQYPIFAKVVAVIFCLSAFILAAVIILSISVNSDDEDID